MELALKYRIVGASVLLSLAVIFIPMILDGSGQERVSNIDLDIPKEPTLVFSEDIAQQAAMPAPEFTRSQQEVEVVPEPDIQNNIVPETVVSKDTPETLLSWIVQVGAFGEEQAAIAFKDKLTQSGFDVFVETGKSNNKIYYRVKVGPMISQDEAEKTRDKLIKKHNIEAAFVTRHPRVEG